MQLFVRGFANTFALEVEKTLQGADLRERIAQRMEVDPESLVLTGGARIIRDEDDCDGLHDGK